jgi:nicotinamidase/pyrazinamidase
MTMEGKVADEALIVIDVQNDFCPGGALAVSGGDEIVPVVNRLIERFEHVVLTQDWHPAGHSSFASSHAGKEPFSGIDMPYGPQTLWPDHCVQGTNGAEFHSGLEWTKAELVVRKGFRKAIDSYSAFFENDHKTPTGLAGYLRERGIKARIARRGKETSEKLGRHRWVVERTLAWLARYRRLAVRYERRSDIHEAFLHLGCSLICLNYLS